MKKELRAEYQKFKDETFIPIHDDDFVEWKSKDSNVFIDKVRNQFEMPCLREGWAWHEVRTDFKKQYEILSKISNLMDELNDFYRQP